MDLILWRHAQAHPLNGTGDDAKRRLTARGEAQAQLMARWLNERLAHDAMVWCSPAVRCVGTAAALGRPFLTDHELRVQASGLSVLAHLRSAAANGTGSALGLRDSALVLVGHQPWLGELAAALLGLEAQACNFNKAAVWWFEPQAQTKAQCRAVRAALRTKVSPQDLGAK